MPKVLRILNRFNLGGPTYNAAYLTKYLAPGYQTLLIGGEKDPTEESSEFILKALDVDYRIIPGMKRSINPFSDISAFRQISAIIKEYKPDIVHTHASKAGAIGRLAAWYNHVPLIVHTFHGHVLDAYFGNVKSFIFRKIEHFLAGISTSIIAISNAQKNDLTLKYKVCKPEKVEVIPLGFDLSRFQQDSIEKRKSFRTRYGLEDDVIAVGIIGRLVPVKNHSLFLEAFRHVLDHTNKKVKGFIIGDGEQREHIETIAKSLEIKYVAYPVKDERAQLVFTSWIKDVDTAIAGLDIIVLTSVNEGTPVSLIEAQAGGKPVVSTRVGGIEDVVIPERTALLAQLQDKASLFDNLLKLIDNDQLRSQMGEEGAAFVKDRFDYHRLVADTGSLYQRLLKRNLIGKIQV